MKMKMSILVASILIIFIFGILVVLNIFGFYVPSKGFTVEKFDQISEGMSQSEVVALLGPPIKKVEVGSWNERCSEYWDYSKKPVYSLSYKRFTVFFDLQGRVLRTTVQMDS